MTNRKHLALIVTTLVVAGACSGGGAASPAAPATVAPSAPAASEPAASAPAASEEAPSTASGIGPGEGELNLVIWAGYAERGATDPAYDWVTPFQDATGCQV